MPATKDGDGKTQPRPGRIYVHLGANEWTLRANINKRSTTKGCNLYVDDTIQVKPLSEMLATEAIEKRLSLWESNISTTAGLLHAPYIDWNWLYKHIYFVAL